MARNGTEKEQERDAAPRFRKRHIRGRLILLVMVLVLILAAFFGGLALAGQEKTPEITSDLLSQELRTAQELVSVEYHYTNMGKFENQMDFYGWKVPFTGKSFIISYDGIVKAGVDMAAVEVRVNESAKTVTVTLPQSRVISHEIPESSIQVFDETHNIFNPISIEDYTSFTRDQKKAMEDKATENGLLTAASEKAKLAVSSLLGMVPGMEGYSLEVR